MPTFKSLAILGLAIFNMLPSMVELNIPRAITANTRHLKSNFTLLILSDRNDAPYYYTVKLDFKTSSCQPAGSMALNSPRKTIVMPAKNHPIF
jgi:hypothetical protein